VTAPDRDDAHGQAQQPDQIAISSASFALTTTSTSLIAPVGELLDLGLGATLVVLGDLLVLQQFLDLLVGIAADVADRDLGVLAFAVHVLGSGPCDAPRSAPGG
jgi:hypothetical protein